MGGLTEGDLLHEGGLNTWRADRNNTKLVGDGPGYRFSISADHWREPTMYQRWRTRLGVAWLILCLILIIVSGEARAFVIFGLVIATLFFLGFEKIIKAVLGKDG
jgi:hypothetical protein